VFVGATRKELLAAMNTFFRVPRAKILVADVLGAWLVDDGVATTFYGAKPFVAVAIAKQELPFEKAADLLVGELDGAIPRAFLAKGKANASDAKETDEEDDEEAELKPFKFQFDAKAFLAQLPAIDGEPMSDQRVMLVRPVGVEGHIACDDAYYHPNVEVSPGWSDAEVDSKPNRFDPKSRFRRSLEVPTM